jgi:hypothetical protein
VGYRAPFPVALQQVEYTKLYFHLEIDTYFDLPPLGLLQLRRELMQALKSLSVDVDILLLKQLLQPELSVDPVVLRQVQKPSPALVISPDIFQSGLIEPKQQIILPVLFIGSGVRSVVPFITLLLQLEKQGLYHGSGTFRLVDIEAEDGSGTKLHIWSAGSSCYDLTPPLSNLAWWLERQPPLTEHVEFEVISPIRALQKQKPLFRAHFSSIFPHILRRVSSLAAAHGGVELIDNPEYFFDLVARVKSVGKPLVWQDWRTLKSQRGRQNLGGLTGTLNLEGVVLEELWWLLHLGRLFNIGKGATYGAGQYRMNYS